MYEVRSGVVDFPFLLTGTKVVLCVLDTSPLCAAGLLWIAPAHKGWILGTIFLPEHGVSVPGGSREPWGCGTDGRGQRG